MTTEDLSLGDALLDRLCALAGQDVNQTQAPDEMVSTRPVQSNAPGAVSSVIVT